LLWSGDLHRYCSGPKIKSGGLKLHWCEDVDLEIQRTPKASKSQVTGSSKQKAIKKRMADDINDQRRLKWTGGNNIHP